MHWGVIYDFLYILLSILLLFAVIIIFSFSVDDYIPRIIIIVYNHCQSYRKAKSRISRLQFCGVYSLFSLPTQVTSWLMHILF